MRVCTCLHSELKMWRLESILFPLPRAKGLWEKEGDGGGQSGGFLHCWGSSITYMGSHRDFLWQYESFELAVTTCIRWLVYNLHTKKRHTNWPVYTWVGTSKCSTVSLKTALMGWLWDCRFLVCTLKNYRTCLPLGFSDWFIWEWKYVESLYLA